jgi:hypothetical protein
MRYEYIRVPFDLGDLSKLNNYSMIGWRVIQVIKDPLNQEYALLERPIPGGYYILPAGISKSYNKKK